VELKVELKAGSKTSMPNTSGSEKILARDLLASVVPDEAEFFEEYWRGINHRAHSPRLGPEFGLHDLASLGPLSVSMGVVLYDFFRECAADVPKRIVEGLIADGAKAKLKGWLASPSKGELENVVTDEGKAEIMSIIGGLIEKAKLEPDEAELITRKVIAHLFGPKDTDGG
jgi:hypothetical protein